MKEILLICIKSVWIPLLPALLYGSLPDLAGNTSRWSLGLSSIGFYYAVAPWLLVMMLYLLLKPRLPKIKLWLRYLLIVILGPTVFIITFLSLLNSDIKLLINEMPQLYIEIYRLRESGSQEDKSLKSKIFGDVTDRPKILDFKQNQGF